MCILDGDHCSGGVYMKLVGASQKMAMEKEVHDLSEHRINAGRKCTDTEETRYWKLFNENFDAKIILHIGVDDLPPEPKTVNIGMRRYKKDTDESFLERQLKKLEKFGGYHAGYNADGMYQVIEGECGCQAEWEV